MTIIFYVYILVENILCFKHQGFHSWLHQKCGNEHGEKDGVQLQTLSMWKN